MHRHCLGTVLLRESCGSELVFPLCSKQFTVLYYLIYLLYFKVVPPVAEFLGLVWVTTLKENLLFSEFHISLVVAWYFEHLHIYSTIISQVHRSVPALLTSEVLKKDSSSGITNTKALVHIRDFICSFKIAGNTLSMQIYEYK